MIYYVIKKIFNTIFINFQFAQTYQDLYKVKLQIDNICSNFIKNKIYKDHIKRLSEKITIHCSMDYIRNNIIEFLYYLNSISEEECLEKINIGLSKGNLILVESRSMGARSGHVYLISKRQKVLTNINGEEYDRLYYYSVINRNLTGNYYEHFKVFKHNTIESTVNIEVILGDLGFRNLTGYRDKGMVIGSLYEISGILMKFSDLKPKAYQPITSLKYKLKKNVEEVSDRKEKLASYLKATDDFSKPLSPLRQAIISVMQKNHYNIHFYNKIIVWIEFAIEYAKKFENIPYASILTAQQKAVRLAIIKSAIDKGIRIIQEKIINPHLQSLLQVNKLSENSIYYLRYFKGYLPCFFILVKLIS